MSPTYLNSHVGSVCAFRRCLNEEKSEWLKGDFLAVHLGLTFPGLGTWVPRHGICLLWAFCQSRVSHSSRALTATRPCWREISMNCKTAWIHPGRQLREEKQRGLCFPEVFQRILGIRFIRQGPKWISSPRLSVCFATILPLYPGGSGVYASDES